MRLRKDPQAILIFHSTLPHLATVENPWISGKTLKVSSGMSHTLCWGCRIKGSQMPVFQLATLGSPRESETTKKHVCIPGPHLRLTEALGQAWKISILEIFPRGSERQLLGLNVLYDQTGIQKDFKRLEECTKKDKIHVTLKFRILRISLRYWRSWDKYRIGISSERIGNPALKVCVYMYVCVCVKYRIGKTAPNILHLTHSVWPLIITLHQAWRLTYVDHSSDFPCPLASGQPTGSPLRRLEEERRVRSGLSFPEPSLLEVCLQLKVTGPLHDSLPPESPFIKHFKFS